jgi:hypothetical protein
MPWVLFELTIAVFEGVEAFHALGRGATAVLDFSHEN